MVVLNKKLWALLSAMLILSFTACSDNDSDSPINPGEESGIEALIVNQGKYGTNTGSISVIYRNGKVNPDIFKQVNNRPLGDAAQSITEINKKYFVSLSNSKKIEVIDPQSFKSLGTILYKEEGSPRQIIRISAEEAIVSDYKSQLVRIKTTAPYDKPLEYIPTPEILNNIIVAKNKLFGTGKEKLHVFDLNNIKAESIRTIEGIQCDETCRMLIDKNDKIWVLNNKDKDKIVFDCIDPQSEKVIKSYSLPLVNKGTAKPGDVVEKIFFNRTDIDPALTWIYFNAVTFKAAGYEEVFTQQSVYRINIENGQFELYKELPSISMMYGFGVSPEGNVFICDCLDYSAQRGFVRKYKADGGDISFPVGIYPAEVFFPKE